MKMIVHALQDDTKTVFQEPLLFINFTNTPTISMTDSLTEGMQEKPRSIHDHLKAIKAARAKEKKSGLKGPSPVKKIEKQKRSNKALRRGSWSLSGACRTTG